jgi:hypothetical protein
VARADLDRLVVAAHADFPLRVQWAVRQATHGSLDAAGEDARRGRRTLEEPRALPHARRSPGSCRLPLAGGRRRVRAEVHPPTVFPFEREFEHVPQ